MPIGVAMRTRRFVWSPERVKWLEDAAEYSGYYNKLAEQIAPFLEPDFSICEIGCGLGYLACALAPMVKHVSAIDISHKAIAKASMLADRKKISNITLLEKDWRSFQTAKKFDAVIICYFSAVRANWSQLEKLSSKYIIAILANGKSGTNLISNQYNPSLEDPQGRDTVPNVTAYLRRKNISYKLIEQQLEYGQPLKDYEDGVAFVKEYYAIKGRENIKAYLEENLQSLGMGYYLPKQKKSGIIVIDLL